MHFKLDLKAKMTLMKKKKSDESGTFSNQTFTCPPFVVLENTCVSGISGWRRNGWKSASGVPSTVWKEKQRGGRRNPTFIPSLGRMLLLELSGIYGPDSSVF